MRRVLMIFVVAAALLVPVSTGPTARPARGAVAQAAIGTSPGYWMLGSDGQVYPFGAAQHHGNAATPQESADLEPTPSGTGYWIVSTAGRIDAFGDARGRVADLARPVALEPGELAAGLSATPAGDGLWLFTTRGRVLSFGAARSFGDMGGTRLNGAVVDAIPTPSGGGYYMVGSDGGIFSFGDARFAGSMGGHRLNAPVQSLVPDGDGSGYWLVASDGGIFAFDAPFRGSMGGVRLNRPVVGMVRYGNGYLMVGADGGIFNFSDQPFAGSLGARPPARPVVAVAAFSGVTGGPGTGAVTGVPSGPSDTSGGATLPGGESGGAPTTTTPPPVTMPPPDPTGPPSTGWVDAGLNLAARYDHTATLLADGRVLVAGGQSGGWNDGTVHPLVELTATELWDPATRRWTAGPSLHHSRNAATATRLADGRVLLVGGWDYSGSSAVATTTEIFDPVANRWTDGPSLHFPRNDHTTTLLADGRVLVVGGYDQAEILDAGARQWQLLPADPAANRIRHSAVRLADGRVLLIAGACSTCGGSGYFDRVDIFNPATNTFSSAAPTEFLQMWGSAVVLNDGSVLLAGVWTEHMEGNGFAWRYLPAENRWVPAASLGALGGAPLLKLPDGRVMAVGTGDVGRGAETYDPATDTWAEAGGLAEFHRLGALTVLADGSVLVTGGDLLCDPHCDRSEQSVPTARLKPTCMGHLATIVGTPGPDVLKGTPGKDVIAGLGGDDVIEGGDGVDTICGGPGNDRLNGGAGKDDISGGTGDDTIDGGPDIDKLWGDDGNDTIAGGDETHDALYGGRGDDHLDGGESAGDICADTTATFTRCDLSSRQTDRAAGSTFTLLRTATVKSQSWCPRAPATGTSALTCEGAEDSLDVWTALRHVDVHRIEAAPYERSAKFVWTEAPQIWGGNVQAIRRMASATYCRLCAWAQWGPATGVLGGEEASLGAGVRTSAGTSSGPSFQSRRESR